MHRIIDCPSDVSPDLPEGRVKVRLWLVLLLVCGIVVLTIGLAGARLMKPAHRINRDAFRQIGPGMQEWEVEGVLGAPARDYTTQPVEVLQPFCDPVVVAYRPAGTAVEEKEWRSDDAFIRVGFDPNGRVAFKSFTLLLGRLSDDESTFSRLRRWLGA